MAVSLGGGHRKGDAAIDRHANDVLRADLSPIERVTAFAEMVKGGACSDSYEPLLPLLLSLKGKPYTLDKHFPFAPVFKRHQPHRMVIKAGRQVGKSISLAASTCVQSAATPYFSTLFVTPLFEQVRRFSSNAVSPFIEESPIRALLMDSTSQNSVLSREFRNKSRMTFSYACLNSNRIRGISADRVGIDEIQNMEYEHIPIVIETMSGTEKHGIASFTGTPLTLDNTIESCWTQSSQSEFFVKCLHCNEFNIPSAEYHLLKMIGPYHDGIGPDCPGTVCYKCQKPIDPRRGGWVPRNRDRHDTYAGYHISQIMMPGHYASAKNWKLLLGKLSGAGNTTIGKFYNEVLGESYDVGTKLVSLADLQRAASLGWENKPNLPDQKVFERLAGYMHLFMGIDWGGGGEKGVSFTTLALVGMRHDGSIEVLWGKRLLAPNDHVAEALECLHWIKTLKPNFICHDFNGAGAQRETFLVQAGVPLEKLLPFAYIRAAAGNIIRYIAPTDTQPRWYYRVDKPRSVMTVCHAIKLCMIRTFSFDGVDNDNRGLLSDFLALVEEKTDTRAAGDFYTIRRAHGQTDDFAHAITFACMGLWHHSRRWPDFGKAIPARALTAAQVLAVEGSPSHWAA